MRRRIVGGQRTQQPEQHLDVEQQVEHVVVARAERRLPQAVERRLAGRRRASRARDGRNPGNAGLEAASTKNVNGPGPIVRQRHTGAAGVDALQRLRRRATPGPRTGSRRSRDGSRGRSPPRAAVRRATAGTSAVNRNHVVPHGRLQWAPIVERPVVAGHRLVERHRLAGHVPRRDGQRDRVAVHRRQHPLVKLAPDASLDELEIVVHDARLVIAAITLAA